VVGIASCRCVCGHNRGICRLGISNGIRISNVIRSIHISNSVVRVQNLRRACVGSREGRRDDHQIPTKATINQRQSKEHQTSKSRCIHTFRVLDSPERDFRWRESPCSMFVDVFFQARFLTICENFFLSFLFLLFESMGGTGS